MLEFDGWQGEREFRSFWLTRLELETIGNVFSCVHAVRKKVRWLSTHATFCVDRLEVLMTPLAFSLQLYRTGSTLTLNAQ